MLHRSLDACLVSRPFETIRDSSEKALFSNRDMLRIDSALPSDTRSRIRKRKRRSRLRQHRVAAPALTDASGADTIPHQMQSES